MSKFSVYRYSRATDDNANQYPSISWKFVVHPETSTCRFFTYYVAVCDPEKEEFSYKSAKQILNGSDVMIFHGVYDETISLVDNAINELRKRSNNNPQCMPSHIVKQYDIITNLNNKNMGSYESTGIFQST